MTQVRGFDRILLEELDDVEQCAREVLDEEGVDFPADFATREFKKLADPVKQKASWGALHVLAKVHQLRRQMQAGAYADSMIHFAFWLGHTYAYMEMDAAQLPKKKKIAEARTVPLNDEAVANLRDQGALWKEIAGEWDLIRDKDKTTELPKRIVDHGTLREAYKRARGYYHHEKERGLGS